MGKAPTSLVVSPHAITLNWLGETAALSATLRDKRGSVVAGLQVQWSSADSTVASVTAGGVATGRKVGRTTVYARYDGLSDSASVVVQQVPARISVQPSAATLAVGDSVRLVAAVTDSGGSAIQGAAVRWLSSDTTIASVTVAGIVAARRAGQTSVTASAGSVAAAVAISVTAPPAVAVVVSPTAVTIHVGDTIILSGHGVDAAGNWIDRPLSWRSLNPAVASIDAQQVVTGLGAGTAAIRGEIDGVYADAQVTVLENPPTSASTHIVLQSDPGDGIGRGDSYDYTQANALVTVLTNGAYLQLRVTGDKWWIGEFQLPNTLTRLQPGQWTGLTRYPFHDPAVGGLSWSGDGRACNTLVGSLTITQALYQGDRLVELDLSFEQHCDGAVAALHGSIHWSASDTTAPPGPVYPVPDGLWRPAAGATPTSGNFAYLVSDSGDWIGGGQTYTLASITASADTGHLRVTAADAATSWTGEFQTMYTLSRLEPGYYPDLQRYPFHNPARGGLSWSGNGRGCNTLSGWFAIDRVAYAADGALSAVDLRFEQHCEGLAPALHGEVHWSR